MSKVTCFFCEGLGRWRGGEKCPYCAENGPTVEAVEVAGLIAAAAQAGEQFSDDELEEYAEVLRRKQARTEG